MWGNKILSLLLKSQWGGWELGIKIYFLFPITPLMERVNGVLGNIIIKSLDIMLNVISKDLVV